MTETFIHSRFYKILHALLNVGLWIAIGVFFISLFLLLIKPDMMFNLAFDGFVFINIDLSKATIFKIIFLITFIMMMLTGIFCVWMLRNIINSLQIGSPFTLKNVKRIRMVGWTLIAQAYLRQILYFVFADQVSQVYLNSGMNSVIQARFNLIPEGAVLALCILFLAEIFRYGCTLQTEHDSTV